MLAETVEPAETAEHGPSTWTDATSVRYRYVWGNQDQSTEDAWSSEAVKWNDKRWCHYMSVYLFTWALSASIVINPQIEINCYLSADWTDIQKELYVSKCTLRTSGLQYADYPLLLYLCTNINTKCPKSINNFAQCILRFVKTLPSHSKIPTLPVAEYFFPNTVESKQARSTWTQL